MVYLLKKTENDTQMLNYLCFSMLIPITSLLIQYMRGNLSHYHFHLKNNAALARKRNRRQNPHCIGDPRLEEWMHTPSCVSRELLRWKFNLNDWEPLCVCVCVCALTQVCYSFLLFTFLPIFNYAPVGWITLEADARACRRSAQETINYAFPHQAGR